ncbi:MAG: CHASE2 domain-containing protein, partial [Acidobacteria bacterium]|nr:CHASE2 domain-containing protein [Acidobacteriota bacterium]
MKLVNPSKFRTAGYVLTLAACLLVAIATGWTALGDEIDNDAYDFLFRLNPPKPWPLDSIVLAADEDSLREFGGMKRIRTTLAEVLEKLAEAHPKVVAIDVFLADSGDEPEDARLEAAFRKTKNLVLPCAQAKSGWEYPIPRFRRWAAAVGHVHAIKDPLDSVSRSVPLEVIAFHDRRWALSLEAYRLALGGGPILESPADLQIGSVTIPARRHNDVRAMLVRYLPPESDASSRIPMVSFAEILRKTLSLERFRDKVVFVGIMAESAAWDRLMTPYSFGRTMPGVEAHAHAFETLHSGLFLRPAPESIAILCSVILVIASGLVFRFLSGWPAYAAGMGVLLLAHLTPYFLFRQGIVFPYMGALAAAWLSAVAAATYQHFIVRRNLRQSETERGRYRQAIHLVTHEMRTPLTAIQGSSELMGRYAMNDEKRQQ